MLGPRLTIGMLCVGAAVALAGLSLLKEPRDGRFALSTDEIVTINLACAEAGRSDRDGHDACVRRQIQELKDHPAPDPAARTTSLGRAARQRCEDRRQSGFALYHDCLRLAMAGRETPADVPARDQALSDLAPARAPSMGDEAPPPAAAPAASTTSKPAPDQAISTQLTDPCIAAAASDYGLAEPALRMILKVEEGQVGSCTAWDNGLHDCGPAQVNSEIWVPQFAQLLDRPPEDVFHAIRDNGCFNIQAAAYILRQKIEEAGGDVWDGLGRYNNAEPSRKQAYQLKLIEAYKEIYENRRAGTPPTLADLPPPPSHLPHLTAAKKSAKVTVIYGEPVTR
jgi:hypothetical protein